MVVVNIHNLGQVVGVFFDNVAEKEKTAIKEDNCLFSIRRRLERMRSAGVQSSSAVGIYRSVFRDRITLLEIVGDVSKTGK